MRRTVCNALRFAATRREPDRDRATIDVAVAVVRDGAGRVLLAQRTARQVSAGFWELPGGKIDAGETAEQAAARELREETGLHGDMLTPWKVYAHAFPTRRVRLHFFRVERFSGQPQGREGQRLAWVDPAAPAVGPLLPSNQRALTLLGLPAVLHEACIERADGAATLIENWPALAAHGARWLLLRAPALPPAQRTLLVQRLRERCRRASVSTPLIVLAGSTLEAHRAGCAGLLAQAPAPGPLPVRPPVDVWAMDCADAEGAVRAEAAGADLLIAAPAGPHRLREIARAVTAPVFVRAAQDSERAAAQACGAAGIALDLRGQSAASIRREAA